MHEQTCGILATVCPEKVELVDYSICCSGSIIAVEMRGVVC